MSLSSVSSREMLWMIMLSCLRGGDGAVTKRESVDENGIGLGMRASGVLGGDV